MDKAQTRASVSAIILSILQHGDSYGYAIINKVKHLSGGEIEWAAGTLYPVLHRMKANGWVEDYWTDEATPRRKYYRITAKGLKALEQERSRWVSVNRVLDQLWTAGR